MVSSFLSLLLWFYIYIYIYTFSVLSDLFLLISLQDIDRTVLMSLCSSLATPHNNLHLDNSTGCISFLTSALDANRLFLASSSSSPSPPSSSISSSLQAHIDACNPTHLSSLASCREILHALVTAFTSLHQLNDSLSQIQNLEFEKVKVSAIIMTSSIPGLTSSSFFSFFL